MTYFCPSCWSEVGLTDATCPHCGANLRALDAQSFAEKLRAALRHPEPQTAVRAAWILGERRDTSAVPDLIHALENAQDSFLAEAAAEALGKIGDPEALPALTRAAQEGTVRVRNASKAAIERIHKGQPQQSLREKES
jgi:HEAT repeat protein